jgi:hypothetical protein
MRAFFGWMHAVHLFGFSELAATLGISKQNTRRHTARPEFPAPVARLACGPVWSADDVLTYLEQHQRP